VIVEQQGEDAVVVRLARVIPEREAWLYENPKALAAVRRGLDQARRGKVAKNPPDLKAAAKLAARLED
jgi:PHD/YefM family antitoxin component YafN of YafNO toxin-antitoxin module